MRIGFIGAGNMASALARGLGEPALVSDISTQPRLDLAAAIGGRAVESNVEVAQGSDLIFLCHKPKQLDKVAAELRDHAKVVVSILGGVPLATVEAAYPDRPVYRAIPNIPVETKQGVVVWVSGQHATEELDSKMHELLGRMGANHRLHNEELMDVCTALASCGPAFLALVAEALMDAGVRHGLSAQFAAMLVHQTMAGTAAVLRESEGDTRGLRTRVTSPGGMTAKGLGELEAGGVRASFERAVAAAAGVGG